MTPGPRLSVRRWAPAVTAALYLAFAASAAADLLPFYMLINVPQYSALPPHQLMVENPYVVVSRMGKVDPQTNMQSKYFFLKHLQDTDDATFAENTFLHDLDSGLVYSETTFPSPAASVGGVGGNPSPQSPDSIEAYLEMGTGDAAADMGAQGADAYIGEQLQDQEDMPQPMPQVILDLDVALATEPLSPPLAVPQTEYWEVFGDLDVPGNALSGALRAANLEGTSSVAPGAIQNVFGGNQKIVWRTLKGLPLGSGEVDGQLWLWRCWLPLGDQFKTRFPTMDAEASAAFYQGLQYLLLIRPKYQDPAQQTPANHESWDFDGQACYRIQPWRNVLGLKVGDINNRFSLQPIDDGELFPPSNVNSVNGNSVYGGSVNSGSVAGSVQSPDEWTQQIEVPQKSESSGGYSGSVSGSVGSPQ
ncbi:hypothetical protein Dda_5228 [Drechslerella dactyloides]|uniref:Uncharacterized protein n=1 Tax=Drechslerella dactyloides TaxID=74499 RepID=A0AAD6IXW6_DREDA|nr:hypothetical protein Dda_5228 [Drechslerella dactyloides]